MKAQLKKYRVDRHDYLAISDGEEIIVDPFVGAAWDNDMSVHEDISKEGMTIDCDGIFATDKYDGLRCYLPYIIN